MCRCLEKLLERDIYFVVLDVLVKNALRFEMHQFQIDALIRERIFLSSDVVLLSNFISFNIWLLDWFMFRIYQIVNNYNILWIVIVESQVAIIVSDCFYFFKLKVGQVGSKKSFEKISFWYLKNVLEWKMFLSDHTFIYT